MRFEPRHPLKLAALRTAAKMAATGALIGTVLTGCDRVRDVVGLSAEDARALGKQAYIAGFPLVTHYATMYPQNIDRNSPAFKGPINVILSEAARLPAPGDAGANRPNGDVILSTLQADLRAEPLVLCVPAIAKERYYSLQFTDMNMYNFGSFDNQKNSGAAGCVLLIGPNFLGQIPTGVKTVMRSSTDFARVIYRTQVLSPQDIDVAAQLQAGFTLQTLAAFRGAGLAPPQPVAAVEWLPLSAGALTTDFAKTVDFLLRFAPQTDPEILAAMGRIGIGPERRKAFDALPAETRDAVLAGFQDGAAAIAARAKAMEKRVNGWRVDGAHGDQVSFGGDTLKRAAAASVQPFGPTAANLAFVPTETDGQGRKLDASARRYVLTFPAGLTPPADAFWSLSIYDARTGGLVANPLNRYRINSAHSETMVRGEDGSLTVYLAAQTPGPGLEANWLPAPAGPFSLVLRLYRPTVEAPSILPIGDGSWRPPAVTAAN